MDTRSQTPLLQLRDLGLVYQQGPREIHVLKGASASVEAGQVIALLGPSGSGKSSLLHLVGLLEEPGSGSIVLEGIDCADLSDGERTAIRRDTLGFVYQFHHLLPEFSAFENVVLPQLIAGVPRAAAESRAQELLASMGLSDRAEHRPAQLSGGEQQRVAIVRAVANSPKLLLADEPTGNLDPQTAEQVFDRLTDLVANEGLTAIIATHNLDIARRMDRIWRLEEGKLAEIAPAKA
ncbi:MAG: ABC transporter ATP-binding protein [Hyphomicrobiales bacterium]|nr:ABC transporter ATP-binding protein [Hyphomicrobiales bacterium]